MDPTTSVVIVVAVCAVALFLGILTLLLPYFVWRIHEHVKRIAERLEERSNGDGTDALVEALDANVEALDAKVQALDEKARPK
jgi:predicted PurR-regulated permease PerM